MHRGPTGRFHRSLLWILLVFLPLFSWACGQEGEEGLDHTRPVVVTSIFPVGDLVRTLTQDAARVEVLLPAGASPATFDLTPRQLQDLQDGVLFFMIGGGLDEWVAPLAQDSEGVIRLSRGLELLEGGGHGHGAEGNPHIWLDPILVRDHFLPRMREALVRVLPEKAQGIRRRAEALSDSLTRLDAEIRESLEGMERRAFIATHAAWSYYALRYGLLEAGVIHTHPGQDPSSREMAHLLEEAREYGVGCLFTEPQLGEMAAQALATELSLPTCMLDPLGGPGMEGREGYLQLLRYNTDQFARGLGQGQG